ncbi:MAG: hypothetical protein AAF456_24740, partial [Planctomycetota bacterium]
MSDRLSKEEIIYDVELVRAAQVDPVTRQPEVQQVTNRSLVEQLLSPRSLQIMMGTGGALLVIGLVVWLWSIGLFENPITVAATLGTANLGLLAAGVWLYMKTEFRLAGRGLALLGSLTLPLNLWLYDAQGLIELDQGGHLWLPALACCVIYTLVARYTRDHMFVYAIVGGIVLTGLLFLANPALGSLWGLLSAATLLIAIGAICVLSDHLFSTTAGPFSRDNFGKAFFRAGHIVMAGGLAVLFGGQISGALALNASAIMAATSDIASTS